MENTDRSRLSRAFSRTDHDLVTCFFPALGAGLRVFASSYDWLIVLFPDCCDWLLELLRFLFYDVQFKAALIKRKRVKKRLCKRTSFSFEKVIVFCI